MTERDDRRIDERIAEAYRRPAPLDVAARARLDRALEALPPPRRRPRAARAFAWLVDPWTLAPRLAPALAVLALALAGGVLIGRATAPRGAPPPAAAPPRVAAPPVAAPAQARVVEFLLVAPHASSVALVGDFNGWDPRATPMRRVPAPGGDPVAGSWVVALPVEEGLHAYAFVVDETRWVADPVAPLAPGDGFGFRNSILVVPGRSES